MTERRAYLIFFLSVPALWYALAKLSGLPPLVLPPPNVVGEVIIKEWPNLMMHTWATLRVALIGYAVANVLALSLAVGFVFVKGLEAFSTPWVVVLQNIPFVSIASLLLICFGDALTPKIIIVQLVCLFPLLANISKGFKEVDKGLMDRMRVLNAGKWPVFRSVLWPAALPYYMAAHEIAFTGSILGAVIAEFFYAREGLGYLIVQALNDYRGDRLHAVNLIIAGLSVGAYFLVRALDRWLFRWRRL
jgi:ABC-type nitrate/sulfonate/bicarbonate transport system permease component